MTTPDVTTRVSRLMTDTSAASQATELAKLWRENYRLSADLGGKALQRFLLLALILSLLSTASLSEVSVFGLKFDRLDVPIGLCYLGSAYQFYRFLSLVSLTQLLENVLNYYYEQAYKAWHHEGLTSLTQFPGITNVESSLSSIETRNTWFLRISDWWLQGVLISLTLASIAWFVWAGVIVAEVLPLGLAVAVLLLAILFVLRGALIVVHAVYRV